MISSTLDFDTTRPRGQEMHKKKPKCALTRFPSMCTNTLDTLTLMVFQVCDILPFQCLSVNITRCMQIAGGGSSPVSCKYIDAATALAALLAAVVDQFFQSKCRHGSSQVGLTPPWLDLTCDPWDIWSECGEDMTWPTTKRQRQRRCKSGRSQVSSSCIQKLQKIASVILVEKVQPLWK